MLDHKWGKPSSRGYKIKYITVTLNQKLEIVKSLENRARNNVIIENF